jgi:hypothetical protein
LRDGAAQPTAASWSAVQAVAVAAALRFRRHKASRPPPAATRLGRPAPATGPGADAGVPSTSKAGVESTAPEPKFQVTMPSELNANLPSSPVAVRRQRRSAMPRSASSTAGENPTCQRRRQLPLYPNGHTTIACEERDRAPHGGRAAPLGGDRASRISEAYGRGATRRASRPDSIG